MEHRRIKSLRLNEVIFSALEAFVPCVPDHTDRTDLVKATLKFELI